MIKRKMNYQKILQYRAPIQASAQISETCTLTWQNMIPQKNILQRQKISLKTLPVKKLQHMLQFAIASVTCIALLAISRTQSSIIWKQKISGKKFWETKTWTTRRVAIILG